MKTLRIWYLAIQLYGSTHTINISFNNSEQKTRVKIVNR